MVMSFIFSLRSAGNVGSGCLESALAGLDLDNRNLHRAQAIISTVSQHTSNPKVLTQVHYFPFWDGCKSESARILTPAMRMGS